MTESREKTLKLISLFSSARLLSEVFYFFRGILLAKILGPSLLGIWTQMKISLLFMAYSNLGTSEAMFREVPYAVGKGCQARADRIKRAAWGLNFITSSILALIVFGYFFWVRTDMGGDIRLSWHLFCELVSKGFPIMMSVALLTMLWNVDKIAISLFMDTRSLGVYALQSYIINILTIIPHAVSTVLYPSLMEKIGMAREENTVKNHLIQPTLAMSYLICPFLSAIFIALHIPIRWFLPQYTLDISLDTGAWAPVSLCLHQEGFHLRGRHAIS